MIVPVDAQPLVGLWQTYDGLRSRACDGAPGITRSCVTGSGRNTDLSDALFRWSRTQSKSSGHCLFFVELCYVGGVESSRTLPRPGGRVLSPRGNWLLSRNSRSLSADAQQYSTLVEARGTRQEAHVNCDKPFRPAWPDGWRLTARRCVRPSAQGRWLASCAPTGRKSTATTRTALTRYGMMPIGNQRNYVIFYLYSTATGRASKNS